MVYTTSNNANTNFEVQHLDSSARRMVRDVAVRGAKQELEQVMTGYTTGSTYKLEEHKPIAQTNTSATFDAQEVQETFESYQKNQNSTGEFLLHSHPTFKQKDKELINLNPSREDKGLFDAIEGYQPIVSYSEELRMVLIQTSSGEGDRGSQIDDSGNRGEMIAMDENLKTYVVDNDSGILSV